ncbi:DNA-binding protein H-NS [Paraburkholderia sp. BL6669N2]|uniref:H-NS histone family protein n=1 Tax=Paraburkholderia sp. BL6669N2 TaxID=1938807 RepID=UPI000E244569|nr:H-NS family nucleoid-associated regulatory protein [Paraburkholderia sp. BL6669N2]REG49632.1 DNA-binding protein H-NS [Paraburkholderia sp. BL6669N2]
MATLEQIQAKLRKLQAQAEVLLAKKAQTAVDRIRALMLEHGLTTADIEANAKPGRGGKRLATGTGGKQRVATEVKAKGDAKYRHPKTGATWSGHGRAPAWIADAKDRTRFLIAHDTDAKVSSAKGAKKSETRKSAVATRPIARKGQLKGPQPAMYRDPKSGATWSGRGRAPAWLGTNRAKFLITDAGVAAVEEGDATAAAQPQALVAAKEVRAKVATKKAVAKKVAAKKSAISKASATKGAKAPARKTAAVKKGSTRNSVEDKEVATASEVASVAKAPRTDVAS